METWGMAFNFFWRLTKWTKWKRENRGNGTVKNALIGHIMLVGYPVSHVFAI